MIKPSTIGKMHVLNVGQALKDYINGIQINNFPEPVKKTVKFIVGMYPHIQKIRTKYEMAQPDSNPDLLIMLKGGEKIKINLFYIKGNSKIQPKNIGAKSFLDKYFKSKDLQVKFNEFLAIEYDKYLKSIIETKVKVNPYDNTTKLKRKVTALYPKFEKGIEIFRKNLLLALREHCFYILKEEFNENQYGILNAFKEFLMADSINIITRYNIGNKCSAVEEWNTKVDYSKDIYIYKKGFSTVGIGIGSEAITLRFKLESDPASSIKLATSYDHFPSEDSVKQNNVKSLQKFEQLIEQHTQTNKKNQSNAIGKCYEAMIYYRIVKENISINQVEPQEYLNILSKYSPIISHDTILDLQKSSISAEKALREYLEMKYESYDIKSIQLIPESYLEDRLDTRDLLLVLKVNKKYVEEGFSIKAIAKNNVKITSKNAGAGQILGPKYFNCGYLNDVIEETEVKFKENKLDHMKSLEIVSSAIGENLRTAEQANLKQGIKSILGYAPTLVTVYTKNKSKIIQHGEVKGEVFVYPKTPSAIQTTLKWDDGKQELSLRIKFSAGQAKGWSSLKLACEYTIDV